MERFGRLGPPALLGLQLGPAREIMKLRELREDLRGHLQAVLEEPERRFRAAVLNL